LCSEICTYKSKSGDTFLKMRSEKPSPDIWLRGILLSVFLPLLGGVLGCANRIGGLPSDSWRITVILIYSVYPIALTVVLNLILIGVRGWIHRTYGKTLGLVLLVSIIGFILAFLLLNEFGGAV
jgi:hypothetical protein